MRLHWQDFTGWRERNLVEPYPDPRYRDFASRKKAEVFRARLRRKHGADLVTTMTPVPTPAVRLTRKQRSELLTAAGLPETPGRRLLP